MGHLSEKIKKGEIVYGTAIVSTSPLWSKVIDPALLDFVFLDTEHIPFDRNELTFLCQTYLAKGIAPVVRITSPDPYLACIARDSGAIGVLAPYVEDPGQVKQLVGAVKYRPLKGKRLNDILDGTRIPDTETQNYLENYNRGSLCLINIESRYALENLNKLLGVPGLDGVIIGPHDLSVSLGLPEQYDHPEFEKAVKDIVHKTRNKGLAAGIHFPGRPDLQIKWMKEGVNIILHSSDLFLFAEKLRSDIDLIKRSAGDSDFSEIKTDVVI